MWSRKKQEEYGASLMKEHRGQGNTPASQAEEVTVPAGTVIPVEIANLAGEVRDLVVAIAETRQSTRPNPGSERSKLDEARKKADRIYSLAGKLGPPSSRFANRLAKAVKDLIKKLEVYMKDPSAYRALYNACKDIRSVIAECRHCVRR